MVQRERAGFTQAEASRLIQPPQLLDPAKKPLRIISTSFATREDSLQEIPNPKPQIPNNFKSPNSKRAFGNWDFGFGVCLGFGFWCLEFAFSVPLCLCG